MHVNQRNVLLTYMTTSSCCEATRLLHWRSRHDHAATSSAPQWRGLPRHVSTGGQARLY